MDVVHLKYKEQIIKKGSMIIMNFVFLKKSDLKEINIKLLGSYSILILSSMEKPKINTDVLDNSVRHAIIVFDQNTNRASSTYTKSFDHNNAKTIYSFLKDMDEEELNKDSRHNCYVYYEQDIYPAINIVGAILHNLYGEELEEAMIRKYPHINKKSEIYKELNQVLKGFFDQNGQES
jgi:hypothetical protein